MRHLVVCCDGTWNTPEQELGGVPTPTNVVRLYHAMTHDDDQLRYYHPGVGTGPGLIDHLRGGGLGTGLDANIKSAYSWLATHYRPGDAICLFGFSRGAYTVRSLAGMLAACGLASIPADTPTETRWREIDHLYDAVYRPPQRRDPAKAAPHPLVPIRFLGVWETVGALGIPDSLGIFRLLDIDDRHRFHDTTLNPLVQHARHAVALDETRGPFTPTLWTKIPDPIGEDRSVRQVWFPGNHCDVGGGRMQTGLSDGALQWMIEEASECTGLRFRAQMMKQIRPDPVDVLHDDCTGFYLHLGPQPRAVPLIDEQRSSAVVHTSAFQRQSDPPIAMGSYRPSRVLTVGEQVSCEVHAGQPWNVTGLYLDPGRYAFTAWGQWLDGSRAVGSTGTRDGRFHLPDVFYPAASFMGWWQDRFRALSHDDAAILFGAPRVDSQPWMALMGVVAGEDIDDRGAQRPYVPFPIGAETQQVVERSGYFYAFANDAWGFYGNNKGSLTLTITRTE